MTMDKAMRLLNVTPTKTEEIVVTKAKLTVTAIEYCNSNEAFRRRSKSVPLQDGKEIIKKPKLGLNKSSSMGDIDLTDWNSDDSVGLFTWNKVFVEPWVKECGTYGLEFLFIDIQQREDMQVQDLVENITKNKLCEIFSKTCQRPLNSYRSFNTSTRALPGVLVTPGKRKPSSLPDPECPRPTKTACHLSGAIGNRSQSVGGSPLLKGKRARTRSRAMSLTGQQLLTADQIVP